MPETYDRHIETLGQLGSKLGQILPRITSAMQKRVAERSKEILGICSELEPIVKRFWASSDGMQDNFSLFGRNLIEKVAVLIQWYLTASSIGEEEIQKIKNQFLAEQQKIDRIVSGFRFMPQEIRDIRNGATREVLETIYALAAAKYFQERGISGDQLELGSLGYLDRGKWHAEPIVSVGFEWIEKDLMLYGKEPPYKGFFICIRPRKSNSANAWNSLNLSK